MKPALLILAAGLGSRYGGVKQMDRLGPGGESIIDYSVFDAIRAGFGKVVFVINRKIETDFREIWEPKLQGRIAFSFVLQDPDDLPSGFECPAERTKPWGTGQAVLAGAKEINTPFAVVNADDFYGREAYRLVYDFLTENPDPKACCMLGYRLENTLSEHGTVSRGICEFDAANKLDRILEIKNISKTQKGIGYEDQQGTYTELSGDARISMNMWGFQPLLFQYLEEGFRGFLEKHVHDLKEEYLLPERINELIRDGKISVKMLKTDFNWFGVTYRQDKEETLRRINELIRAGDYPPKLWETT